MEWNFLAQDTVHSIKLYKWAPANTGVNHKTQKLSWPTLYLSSATIIIDAVAFRNYKWLDITLFIPTVLDIPGDKM